MNVPRLTVGTEAGISCGVDDFLCMVDGRWSGEGGRTEPSLGIGGGCDRDCWIRSLTLAWRVLVGYSGLARINRHDPDLMHRATTSQMKSRKKAKPASLESVRR